MKFYVLYQAYFKKKERGGFNPLKNPFNEFCFGTDYCLNIHTCEIKYCNIFLLRDLFDIVGGL